MQHSIEIDGQKKVLYIPSDLSECDSRQYIEMCELILLYQSEKISYEEMRIRAVYALLNMKHSERMDVITETNTLSNIYLISELIDSFFEDNENSQKVIKQFYIHNPVPKITPLWKTHYGPSNGFSNITFGEYVDVLRLFMEFYKTGDFENLYLISAILYRRKKPFLFLRKRSNSYNGDVRVPYNSNKVEQRVKAMKSAPVGFIFGVYLLFASFQKYLTTAVLPWGDKEIDLSLLFLPQAGEESETSSDIPGIGMDSMAFSLAESGAFGNIKEVRNTALWEILVRMYDLRKRDLEEKQKTKQNGSDQQTS